MFAIPRPPWTKLGRTLESATRKALYDFDLLSGVANLGIALSGGKDSLTLLFLLHAINGRGLAPFTLTALHITGEFSCGAGIMTPILQQVCTELDVKLIIRPMPVLKGEIDCYSCSRERRKLLFQTASEKGITHLAFGHHRDDNVQTTLMNLFHKGEFAGLLPHIHMHNYNMTIIRPMIYLAEDDIRRFAEAYGYKRITCRCPIGQTSMRRQTEELLQGIIERYPNAKNNIAQAVLRYGTKKALRNIPNQIEEKAKAGLLEAPHPLQTAPRPFDLQSIEDVP
jgi:tRNA 2-thiocytidine biosynthesis protein TtcA